jgi:hypothetical protein
MSCNINLLILLIIFVHGAYSLKVTERFAFFNNFLAIVDVSDGKVQVFSRLASYSIITTCSIDATTNIIYTAAKNSSVITNPLTILGVSSTTSEIAFGNVTISFSAPRILFTSKLKLVVDITGGYLYQLVGKNLNQIWSFSGNLGPNCDITLDDTHSQFWILCPSGISSFNYGTKTLRSIPNYYNVQSIAYNSLTETIFGVAPAAGNAFIFQIDQFLKWYFMSVVYGLQMQLPPISRFNDQGHLIFIAKTVFSVNIATVNVTTGDILSQPLLAYPTPMIALC